MTSNRKIIPAATTIILLVTLALQHNQAGAYLSSPPPAAFVAATSKNTIGTRPMTRSSSRLSMTISLPSPMSVNAGPLKHEWYEDFGHGSDRRVKYWDDDETVEFAYTAFAYDWKNRIRHPEEEYEETEDQKPGFVRRAFARITRPFRRTI